MKKNIFKTYLQNRYDDFKLYLWNRYFKKNYKSSYCIFVSNWMRNEFYKWTKIKPSLLQNREFVTYNSVGEIFEKETYKKNTEKEFDFITIRSFLDGSKYCVDIVNELAFKNPELNFLLIGRGDYFNHYDKAPNVTWINRMMTHQEMCHQMDLSKCALMPTRTDAQGVMMCEMSAYGMPVITSDIPVCHEVFEKVPGIGFIDNENPTKVSLTQLYNDIKNQSIKSSKYNYSIVCAQELNIIRTISEL